jgi:hypothetical protein
MGISKSQAQIIIFWATSEKSPAYKPALTWVPVNVFAQLVPQCIRNYQGGPSICIH